MGRIQLFIQVSHIGRVYVLNKYAFYSFSLH